jgi:hypothetical protein
VADDSRPPQYTDEDLEQLDELLAEADRRIEKSKAAEAKPAWRRLLNL